MSKGHLVAFAAIVSSLLTVPSARAAEPEPGWQLHLQLATTFMSGNQVLPLPLAIGVSVVAERGMVGFEAGFHSDGATICDNAGGGDGFCGWLLIAEAGPRVRFPGGGRWTPYLSAKGQWLRMTRADAGSWAVAPRGGVSYEGDHLGVFVEAGATVVLGGGADDWRLIGGMSRSRMLPVLVVGLRF